jgi:two-component system cell cycle response regulator DivK
VTTRVLVIEDHPPSLELVRYLLEATGYAALTAADGEIGLAIAETELPDLVICDIQMPKMDGYELLANLRKNPRLRSVPVIAVTAFSMLGDRNMVLKAGFEGYISKPIVPETFIAQVTAYLPAEKLVATPAPNR